MLAPKQHILYLSEISQETLKKIDLACKGVISWSIWVLLDGTEARTGQSVSFSTECEKYHVDPGHPWGPQSMIYQTRD